MTKTDPGACGVEYCAIRIQALKALSSFLSGNSGKARLREQPDTIQSMDKILRSVVTNWLTERRRIAPQDMTSEQVSFNALLQDVYAKWIEFKRQEGPLNFDNPRLDAAPQSLPEDDPEIERLMFDLNADKVPDFDNPRLDGPGTSSTEPLKYKGNASSSGAGEAVVQLGTLQPLTNQAPTPEADRQDKPQKEADTPKTPARAAGSRTGAGKVGSGRPARLPNRTKQEVEAALRAVSAGQPVEGFFPTATEFAAARQSWASARSDSKEPSAPRHADAMVETFWQARWRDLSPAQKLTLAARQIANAGGRAFSLNLSAEREAELRKHPAPDDRMAQLLRDHLRAVGFGGLPIGWAFEVSPKPEGERLHLHGVFELEVAQNADLDRIKEAMRAAGGKITGAAAARQLKLTPITYAPGWASYMLKELDRSAAHLRLDKKKLIHLSKDANRLALEAFEQLRAQALQD